MLESGKNYGYGLCLIRNLRNATERKTNQELFRYKKMDKTWQIGLVGLYLWICFVTKTFSHTTEERIVTNPTNKYKVVTTSKRFKKYPNVRVDPKKVTDWSYLALKSTETLLECGGHCLDETKCVGFFFQVFGSDYNCYLNSKTLRSDHRMYHSELVYFEIVVSIS